MAQSTQAARIAKGKADAEKIFPIVKEKFGDGIVGEESEKNDSFLVVDPKILLDLCRFAKEEDELQFDLLSLISTVDYLPPADAPPADAPPAEGSEGRIEVVYFLDSTVHGHRLCLKIKLSRDDPRVASVDSVWKAAEWHEREAFDLMGVVFEGHPNLVRILCAEDWEGHALRKDYVIPETFRGIRNVVY